MSAPRIPFANATNAPRRSFNHSGSPPTLGKLRKSSPTCTVSLASVSTTGVSIAVSSETSPRFPSSTTNVIPFPVSTDSVDGIGHRACNTSSSLLLLRSSPATRSSVDPSPLEMSPTPHLTRGQERRKRSTARLLQPVTIHYASSGCLESVNQPPRKRPRLLLSPVKAKGTHTSLSKPTPHFTSSDLRFLSSVQRTIALAIKQRRAQLLSVSSPSPPRYDSFEAQDLLLASRLRTLLLQRGIKATDLIDMDDECRPETPEEYLMDVDVELTTSSDDSPFVDDMDIDIEKPSHSFSPPPQCPRHPLLSDLTQPISTSKVIAGLIIRYRTRKPPRSSAGSERNGGGIARGAAKSPLAQLLDDQESNHAS